MNKLNCLNAVFRFGAQDRLLRILKYGKHSTFQTVSVKKLKLKSGEKNSKYQIKTRVLQHNTKISTLMGYRGLTNYLNSH